MDSDYFLDRWVILLQNRKRPSGDSDLRQGHCSFFYLWKPAKKKLILGPDLMFVSNLMTWLILWMIEDGFISLFKVCFQNESRSLPLRASPSLQTDSHWLAKRSNSSLCSSLQPLLHYPSVWFVASNLQTTHLSDQGKICTDPIFRACDTEMCVSLYVWFVC